MVSDRASSQAVLTAKFAASIHCFFLQSTDTQVSVHTYTHLWSKHTKIPSLQGTQTVSQTQVHTHARTHAHAHTHTPRTALSP